MARKRRPNHDKQQWYRVDLHLHTPGSADYEEPEASYLDILQLAESRQLDIIAFTDHNTVKGIRALRKEIEDLELLEQLKRIRPNEKQQLDEYRRLLENVVTIVIVLALMPVGNWICLTV